VLRPHRPRGSDGPGAWAIGDKGVLSLVKAFLRAGIMTEQAGFDDTLTGTPQGGILSPLLANIALSALDQHYARAWAAMGSEWERRKRRARGEATFRLVRYADDCVAVLAGPRKHAEALVAETAAVLASLLRRMWCGRWISSSTPPPTAARSRSCPLWTNTPVNASAAWSTATSPVTPSSPSSTASPVGRGYPAVLRCDNGAELACAAMADWAGERTGLHFIPPGQPWRNGYVESFNSRGSGRVPEHQHVLVARAGTRGDQRLEGGLQPPPTAQRPRLPGPSRLRCSPHHQ
jgi:Reverse transcriptase (RNA-dependent DNA polymerase)